MGPYQPLDITAFYQGNAARLPGLQGLWRAKWGMGDNGDSGISVSSTPVDTSAVNALINAGFTDTSATVDPSTGLSAAVGVNPSTGDAYYISQSGSNGLIGNVGTASASSINWNSLLSSLTAAGTKLGTQALATPGTTILPNGTVVTGSAASTTPLSTSSISSILPWLAVGLVVLLVAKGK
jgi:hypothetical protein